MIVNKTNPNVKFFVVNGTSGNVAIGGDTNPGFNLQFNVSKFIGTQLGYTYSFFSSDYCYNYFVRGRGGFIYGGGPGDDCFSGGAKAYKLLLSDDGGSTDYGLSFDVESDSTESQDDVFISGRAGSIGYVGIGTNNPGAKLDIDSNSNSQSVRIRGASESTEIADIYVGANGMLVLSTANTGAIHSYINVDPKDDQFGFIIRDSNTGDSSSTVYANLYVNDTTKDYINIVVDATTATKGLVVTEDEYVGIKTAAPSKPLTVVGNMNVSTNLFLGNYLLIGDSSSSNDDYLYFDAGTNYFMWDDAGDRFVVSNDIFINGQITMATFTSPGVDPMCWDNSSDSAIGDCSSLRKYKENIRDYTIGLNDVVKLRPRIYDWINGSSNNVGFIAEEVADSVPSLAKYRDGNLSGYQEFGLSAALVNSVKELKQRNDVLKKELCIRNPVYAWCK